VSEEDEKFEMTHTFFQDPGAESSYAIVLSAMIFLLKNEGVRYMTANNRLSVKIKRIHADAHLPRYEHPGDSGADLYAVVDEVLQPLERKAIPTGLTAEVSPGYELQVRPKSGLALNSGLAVLNTPGTIDAGYRGEIKVILINLGAEPYAIKAGQKIAQLVVAPVIYADFVEADELTESRRGAGGFGSTGLM
jgi:dUTP pyrophosphatase